MKTTITKKTDCRYRMTRFLRSRNRSQWPLLQIPHKGVIQKRRATKRIPEAMKIHFHTSHNGLYEKKWTFACAFRVSARLIPAVSC